MCSDEWRRRVWQREAAGAACLDGKRAGAEAEAGKSERFGAMTPRENEWHARRQLWASLWRHERDWDAEQRAIDAARARAVAGAEQVVEQQVGARTHYKAPHARLQSLYLESDASPNKDMLRHYWTSFTQRPPSRLPAFGMVRALSLLAPPSLRRRPPSFLAGWARLFCTHGHQDSTRADVWRRGVEQAQSDRDLARHEAAAKRAVVRDCGGKADCRSGYASGGFWCLDMWCVVP